MKKWILYSLIVLLGGTFIACKKAEQQVYQDNPRMYFSIPEFTYSFATKPGKVVQDTVKFRLNYTGLTLTKPLVAKISVVTDKTTAVAGTDYELLDNYRMGSGLFADSLCIVVKRTAAIAATPVLLALRLEETNEYKAGLNKDGKTIVFTINDILTKPESWESYLVPYFGAYSKTKYRFIIETLNMSDFPWSMTRDGQLLFLKTKLMLALTAYEKTNGPLIDTETGNLVFFPA